MADQRYCDNTEAHGSSYYSRPNMLRLYIRTNTTVPNPGDKWGRGKVKRTWNPVGHYCPKCRRVDLDKVTE